MIEDEEYFKSNGFQKLLKQYETSVKSGQPIYMDADDLADIADYYQYNGRLEEADAAINLALEYNPDAVGPLLYKARESLLQKDYDSAYAYAERLMAIDQQEALYYKGEILISEGKIEEADDLFRENMKEVMADELMDYVYDVASIFSDYNVFDKAFEWVARSQGDDSDDFKELMARTLFGLGKFKDSERIFNELIDHNPYSTRYWIALASAQFMNEDYHSAITSSEYAIAIDPNDAESVLAKANSLYNLEDYESAFTFYQRYSQMVGDDEFGYLHQGTSLINLGRYEDAIEVLKQAEELAKGGSSYLPEIYQELAFAYSELHQADWAISYIDKTWDLDCDHVNMEVIRGHILLADERKEEAEKSFRKALKLSDNSPHTMLRIIVSLYDNRYVHSAYILLKGFLKQTDDNWTDGYSYMALCCLDLNKKEEFLHYLKLASEKNPKEAKTVLGNLFAEGTVPADYYDYSIKTFNKSKK